VVWGPGPSTGGSACQGWIVLYISVFVEISSKRMAKASLSTQFRKVDVDELDENQFQDDQGEDAAESGPNESEVNNLILQYLLYKQKYLRQNTNYFTLGLCMVV
jgi:hypothetical protein